MITCCPLSGGGDRATVCHVRIITAAKQYACSECRETIGKGTNHELVKGMWDGSWSSFRTCLSCVEIRTHFGCGEGWIYGELWSQLEDNFFPDMKAGGPCMEGLSPEAKSRMFERRLVWMGAA